MLLKVHFKFTIVQNKWERHFENNPTFVYRDVIGLLLSNHSPKHPGSSRSGNSLINIATIITVINITSTSKLAPTSGARTEVILAFDDEQAGRRMLIFESGCECSYSHTWQ